MNVIKGIIERFKRRGKDGPAWEEPGEKADVSKHRKAKTKPRGWHTRLRQERKRQKLARRAQRGKR